MFTGLVEEVGRVRSLERLAGKMRLTITAETVTEDIHIGDSIAVNGVCLTATEISKATFAADAAWETLRLTTLGSLRIGDAVNLERALRVGDRFGGHMVLGHVDGVGRITSMEPEGDATIVEVEADPKISRYIVYKGSIAIDGISLTVAGVRGSRFWVSVIPLTNQVTTLNNKRPGDQVNLECDIIGKYVERLLKLDHGHEAGDSPKSPLDMDTLRKFGFI